MAPESDQPRRLDRVVQVLFPELLPSRSAAKKACKAGDVRVDGEVAEPSRFVRPGQLIALYEHAAEGLPAVFELALDVLREDDDWAIVRKLAGYPTSGNRHRTIAHALPFNLRPSPRPDALPRPWPAHRLDAQTSGLLVVAKTARAQAALGQSFKAREVEKTYRALLLGRLEGEGVVDAALDDRPSRTRYAALAHQPSNRVGCITSVDAWPETGRTHQIRRHFADLGHPILGDRLYTKSYEVFRGAGLFLAAVGLDLADPITGAPVSVRIDPPAKFATYLRRAAKAWDHASQAPSDDQA